MSFSYSARKNVIYYETYKSFLDRLLDPDTWQGYMLQVNYTPVKKLSVGVTGSYRYMLQDPRRSKNLYGYVTYSQIPGIGISATLSVTLLATSYIEGNIYKCGDLPGFRKRQTLRRTCLQVRRLQVLHRRKPPAEHWRGQPYLEDLQKGSHFPSIMKGPSKKSISTTGSTAS
ncbi:MAG: hypothetical protein MZV63_60370 [Marinilabiliales bacterium]|nr:hypothetical protein [Marinilabiliales bacterium]